MGGSGASCGVDEGSEAERADELAENLVVTGEPEILALATVLEAARGYAEDSKAANTRRAYRADWRTFEAWCDARGRCALPAGSETVALCLATVPPRGVGPVFRTRE